MMTIRPLVGLTIFAAGFTAAVAVTSLGSSPDPAVQMSAAPTAQAAPPRAASGMPDFSAVADQAVLAAANIASRTVGTLSAGRARDPFFDFFFGGRDPQGFQSSSLGSGVIVSTDGYILTNNHVVGGGRAEITVSLPDNRELPARVIGVDPMTDLAVVKVDTTGLTPLPWGNSDELRLAEWVLAIGNPFALSHSVSLGIVSALRRSSQDLSPYTEFIQTDAAINPGNSGGALVNGRGELVGINSAIATETGGYQGISFAIPANLARRIMAELIEHGEVRWGSIDGVSIQGLTQNLARRIGYDSTRGVVVLEIYRDSAAWEAGVRPGDVITSFNGDAVNDFTQFTRLLADSTVGSTARLGIIQREDTGSRSVTIEVPIVSVQSVRRR
jgi:serine protease Do